MLEDIMRATSQVLEFLIYFLDKEVTNIFDGI